MIDFCRDAREGVLMRERRRDIEMWLIRVVPLPGWAGDSFRP